MKVCSVEGCKAPVKSKGYCKIHYERNRIHGDPLYWGYEERKVCKAEGCETIAYSKGYCQKHYTYWKKHGIPIFIRPVVICKIEGCERIHASKGLCDMHYRRWLKYGDPLFSTHHLKSHDPAYRTWSGMKSRCLNSNQPGYKDYGGRGITVCDRWLDFSNFYADMGDRPDGTEIDRINNNGNYEPSNCRWVTRTENSRNKRSTKLTIEQIKEIRLFCPPFTRKQLAEHYNIGITTIEKIVNYRIWKHI